MNPTLCFEEALAIHPAETAKKIAVVGGGPAGMQAAVVAAKRGHQVTLFEKRKLGGLLHEASLPEFKADIRNALAYLITQVKKAGVEVVEKAAQAEDLAGFDGVILAAGADPIALPVPGADSPKVQLAVDILNEKADGIRGNIVVIGGGLIGTETAVHLSTKEGNHVTVVEMLPQIMKDCSDCDHIVYTEMIKDNHIQVLTSARVVEITADGVVVEKNGRQTIHADHILVAVGLKPNRTLGDQLQEMGVPVVVVGDCGKVGKIYDAIHSGYKAGLRI